MTYLACLTHWYTSMMYVLPVLAVGGWTWWSNRKARVRKAARLARPDTPSQAH